jgi:hypothetical protein
METEAMKECLGIVMAAEHDLAQAKGDYKVLTDAAYEKYELTPEQIKAVKAVAKAKIKNNIKGLESTTGVLVEMINKLK